MNDIYIELKDVPFPKNSFSKFSQIAEKNNITIYKDEPSEDEETNSKNPKSKKTRKRSSIYEMLPDFKNQVIIVQTHLNQIKLNIDEINGLKEQSNKTIAPNKEKGKIYYKPKRKNLKKLVKN